MTGRRVLDVMLTPFSGGRSSAIDEIVLEFELG